MRKAAAWNLKLLQTFTLVAENRSFRKAADESLRSQSAVSAQIKELESQLDVRLFDRTTRRVSLTPEGAELLEYTRRAFAELAVGLENVRLAADARFEKLRVACIPTIAAGLIPEIVGRFERGYPDVRVHIHELNNEDLIAGVQNREVDLGIGVVVPSFDCRFDPLLSDGMYALVARGSFPEHRHDISVRDLIDMPVFLLPQATPTLMVLESESRRSNTALRLQHRFSQPQSMIAMATAGRGAAVLPGIYMEGLRQSEIHAMRIVAPEISRQIAIVTRRGTVMSRPAVGLADIVRGVICHRQAGAGGSSGL